MSHKNAEDRHLQPEFLAAALSYGFLAQSLVRSSVSASLLLDSTPFDARWLHGQHFFSTAKLLGTHNYACYSPQVGSLRSALIPALRILCANYELDNSIATTEHDAYNIEICALYNRSEHPHRTYIQLSQLDTLSTELLAVLPGNVVNTLGLSTNPTPSSASSLSSLLYHHYGDSLTLFLSPPVGTSWESCTFSTPSNNEYNTKLNATPLSILSAPSSSSAGSPCSASPSPSPSTLPSSPASPAHLPLLSVAGITPYHEWRVPVALVWLWLCDVWVGAAAIPSTTTPNTVSTTCIHTTTTAPNTTTTASVTSIITNTASAAEDDINRCDGSCDAGSDAGAGDRGDGEVCVYERGLSHEDCAPHSLLAYYQSQYTNRHDSIKDDDNVNKQYENSLYQENSLYNRNSLFNEYVSLGAMGQLCIALVTLANWERDRISDFRKKRDKFRKTDESFPERLEGVVSEYGGGEHISGCGSNSGANGEVNSSTSSLPVIDTNVNTNVNAIVGGGAVSLSLWQLQAALTLPSVRRHACCRCVGTGEEVTEENMKTHTNLSTGMSMGAGTGTSVGEKCCIVGALQYIIISSMYSTSSLYTGKSLSNVLYRRWRVLLSSCAWTLRRVTVAVQRGFSLLRSVTVLAEVAVEGQRRGRWGDLMPRKSEGKDREHEHGAQGAQEEGKEAEVTAEANADRCISDDPAPEAGNGGVSPSGSRGGLYSGGSVWDEHRYRQQLCGVPCAGADTGDADDEDDDGIDDVEEDDDIAADNDVDNDGPYEEQEKAEAEQEGDRGSDDTRITTGITTTSKIRKSRKTVSGHGSTPTPISSTSISVPSAAARLSLLLACADRGLYPYDDDNFEKSCDYRDSICDQRSVRCGNGNGNCGDVDTSCGGNDYNTGAGLSDGATYPILHSVLKSLHSETSLLSVFVPLYSVPWPLVDPLLTSDLLSCMYRSEKTTSSCNGGAGTGADISEGVKETSGAGVGAAECSCKCAGAIHRGQSLALLDTLMDYASTPHAPTRDTRGRWWRKGWGAADGGEGGEAGEERERSRGDRGGDCGGDRGNGYPAKRGATANSNMSNGTSKATITQRLALLSGAVLMSLRSMGPRVEENEDTVYQSHCRDSKSKKKYKNTHTSTSSSTSSLSPLPLLARPSPALLNWALACVCTEATAELNLRGITTITLNLNHTSKDKCSPSASVSVRPVCGLSVAAVHRSVWLTAGEAVQRWCDVQTQQQQGRCANPGGTHTPASSGRGCVPCIISLARVCAHVLQGHPLAKKTVRWGTMETEMKEIGGVNAADAGIGDDTGKEDVVDHGRGSGGIPVDGVAYTVAEPPWRSGVDKAVLVARAARYNDILDNLRDMRAIDTPAVGRSACREIGVEQHVAKDVADEAMATVGAVGCGSDGSCSGGVYRVCAYDMWCRMQRYGVHGNMHATAPDTAAQVNRETGQEEVHEVEAEEVVEVDTVECRHRLSEMKTNPGENEVPNVRTSSRNMASPHEIPENILNSLGFPEILFPTSDFPDTASVSTDIETLSRENAMLRQYVREMKTYSTQMRQSLTELHQGNLGLQEKIENSELECTKLRNLLYASAQEKVNMRNKIDYLYAAAVAYGNARFKRVRVRVRAAERKATQTRMEPREEPRVEEGANMHEERETMRLSEDTLLQENRQGEGALIAREQEQEHVVEGESKVASAAVEVGTGGVGGVAPEERAEGAHAGGVNGDKDGKVAVVDSMVAASTSMTNTSTTDTVTHSATDSVTGIPTAVSTTTATEVTTAAVTGSITAAAVNPADDATSAPATASNPAPASSPASAVTTTATAAAEDVSTAALTATSVAIAGDVDSEEITVAIDLTVASDTAAGAADTNTTAAQADTDLAVLRTMPAAAMDEVVGPTALAGGDTADTADPVTSTMKEDAAAATDSTASTSSNGVVGGVDASVDAGVDAGVAAVAAEAELGTGAATVDGGIGSCEGSADIIDEDTTTIIGTTATTNATITAFASGNNGDSDAVGADSVDNNAVRVQNEAGNSGGNGSGSGTARGRLLGIETSRTSHTQHTPAQEYAGGNTPTVAAVHIGTDTDSGSEANADAGVDAGVDNGVGIGDKVNAGKETSVINPEKSYDNLETQILDSEKSPSPDHNSLGTHDNNAVIGDEGGCSGGGMVVFQRGFTSTSTCASLHANANANVCRPSVSHTLPPPAPALPHADLHTLRNLHLQRGWLSCDGNTTNLLKSMLATHWLGHRDTWTQSVQKSMVSARVSANGSVMAGVGAVGTGTGTGSGVDFGHAMRGMLADDTTAQHTFAAIRGAPMPASEIVGAAQAVVGAGGAGAGKSAAEGEGEVGLVQLAHMFQLDRHGNSKGSDTGGSGGNMSNGDLCGCMQWGAHTTAPIVLAALSLEDENKDSGKKSGKNSGKDVGKKALDKDGKDGTGKKQAKKRLFPRRIGFVWQAAEEAQREDDREVPQGQGAEGGGQGMEVKAEEERQVFRTNDDIAANTSVSNTHTSTCNQLMTTCTAAATNTSGYLPCASTDAAVDTCFCLACTSPEAALAWRLHPSLTRDGLRMCCPDAIVAARMWRSVDEKERLKVKEKHREQEVKGAKQQADGGKDTKGNEGEALENAVVVSSRPSPMSSTACESMLARRRARRALREAVVMLWLEGVEREVQTRADGVGGRGVVRGEASKTGEVVVDGQNENEKEKEEAYRAHTDMRVPEGMRVCEWVWEETEKHEAKGEQAMKNPGKSEKSQEQQKVFVHAVAVAMRDEVAVSVSVITHTHYTASNAHYAAENNRCVDEQSRRVERGRCGAVSLGRVHREGDRWRVEVLIGDDAGEEEEEDDGSDKRPLVYLHRSSSSSIAAGSAPVSSSSQASPKPSPLSSAAPTISTFPAVMACVDIAQYLQTNMHSSAASTSPSSSPFRFPCPSSSASTRKESAAGDSEGADVVNDNNNDRDKEKQTGKEENNQEKEMCTEKEKKDKVKGLPLIAYWEDGVWLWLPALAYDDGIVKKVSKLHAGK